MKKQIVFFISFLLIGTILIGQNTPVLLVSSTGNISYINGSKPSTRIVNGAVLDRNGTVILPVKAEAMVFCNGEYKKLSIGKNSLKKVCGETTTRGLNIDSKVADFIVSSIELAHFAKGHNDGWVKVTDSKNMSGDGWGADGKDGWGADGKDGWGNVKDGWGADGKDGWGADGKDGWGADGKDGWGADGKDGWGADGKDGWGADGKDGWGADGKDGWGGSGKKIHLILPIGKLESKTTHFSWSKPANSSSYKLEIQDATKTKVHSVIVKDTFADIDLKKLNLKEGSVYLWMVSSVENAEAISKPYQFALEPMSAKKSTESKLSKSKIYAKADHTTRSLMEAVVLEKEDWYYDAAQIYKSLKKKDHNNHLVNMMHAAFWMRSGLTKMADAAIMP